MNILVVDDSPTVYKQLEKHFTRLGHAVAWAPDGEQALDMAQGSEPGFIFLDHYMPGMSGLETLHALREAGVQAPVVMLTSNESIEVAVQAMRDGAQDYVSKPFDLDQLAAVVARVSRDARARGFKAADDATLESIAGVNDLDQVLAAILGRIIEGLDFCAANLYFPNRSRARLEGWGLRRGGSEPEPLGSVRFSAESDLRVRCLESGATEVVDRAYELPESEERFGDAREAVIAAVRVGDGIRAVIEAGRAPDQPPLTKVNIFHLKSFLSQAWSSVERALDVDSMLSRQRDHSHDLEMAGEVQRSLMPKSLDLPEIRIVAALKPALTVCGDFYDFYEIGGDRIDFLIGDVVGKGVQASIVMGHLMALFKREVGLESPARILKAVNRELMENFSEDGFAFLGTAFYAVYRPRTRTLYYASAGHPGPVLIRGGEFDAKRMDPGGMPLGMKLDIETEDSTMIVDPGDVMLFYTDGVTEASAPGGELFGVPGLFGALERNPGADADELISGVLGAVGEHTAGFAGQDDITLMHVSFPARGGRTPAREVIASRIVGID